MKLNLNFIRPGRSVSRPAVRVYPYGVIKLLL